MAFHARTIDADPQLLEQSYRLRYQVYCLERQFLPAADYPDEIETDSFDADSIHVAAIDDQGSVAATARVVTPNRHGLPLFHFCSVFPLATALDDPGTKAVEVSRVSISRQYARRPGDVLLGGVVVPGSDPGAPVVGGHERRRRSGEPFLTLLKSIVAAARGVEATHLIFAIERALQRWLTHYGFPCRLSGPEAEYYGRVAPYILSLAELDEVILTRRFPALEDFPVGSPRLSEHPVSGLIRTLHAIPFLAGRPSRTPGDHSRAA